MREKERGGKAKVGMKENGREGMEMERKGEESR